MPNTNRLINHEQGERIIEALHDIAESNLDTMVAIPVLDTLDFTYDGSEHEIEWSNLNTIRVLITGDTHAIDSGLYTAYANLKSINDTWEDGTSAAKVFTWSIGGGSTSWSSASDAVIRQLVASAYRGECDLHDDYGWSVGDERTVHLNAVKIYPTGYYAGGVQVPAQAATLVLMDTDHYYLEDGVTKCKFVAGFKDCLAGNRWLPCNGKNTGFLNRTDIQLYNQFKSSGIFNPDIASIFRKAIIPVYDNGSVIEYATEFTLPAAKEVKGDLDPTDPNISAAAAEFEVTSQLEYYSVSANRAKKFNGSATTYWFLRESNAAYSSFIYNSSQDIPSYTSWTGTSWSDTSYGSPIGII